MATIIEFRASQSRASSNAHTLSGVPGEIVVFPGVRYDRVDDQVVSRSKQRPTRRDMLELEE